MPKKVLGVSEGANPKISVQQRQIQVRLSNFKASSSTETRHPSQSFVMLETCSLLTETIS